MKLNSKPILYVKRGCSWCREALSFFSQHGIEIDVRDVGMRPQNMQRMIEVSGQTLTPTLEFGEFVVADFSLDELHDELEQMPEVKKEWGLGDDDE